MMQRPALAIAIDMGKTGDAFLTGGKQLTLPGRVRRATIARRHG